MHWEEGGLWCPCCPGLCLVTPGQGCSQHLCVPHAFAIVGRKAPAFLFPLEVNAQQFPVHLFSELCLPADSRLCSRAGAGGLTPKGAGNVLYLPGPAQWGWGLGLCAFIYSGDKLPCVKVPVFPFLHADVNCCPGQKRGCGLLGPAGFPLCQALATVPTPLKRRGQKTELLDG